MQSLLQKMETNAAGRLSLPAGVAPAAELTRFRNFLKVESHRLKILHRGGGSGRVVCHARAAMIDLLISHLWIAAKNTLSGQAQKEFPPLALVALGGYGRAELNPHSDIDIMFLHAGQVVAISTALPSLKKVMDGLLYPLWDLGFKVGHSVRTISESVQVANQDMQAKTSLIEARMVTGDEKLFEKFQRAVIAKCVEGHEDEYIDMRVQDQNARRAKFGNSATMQEPNIKNGCGGLRDVQNLHWMALFKHKTRSLEEMEQREMISASERKQIEAAYDFLLRARTELHYQVNRPADVLTRNLQPAVAWHLGYTDRSPRRRLESFMRDLYKHSRNIFLITRTIEERLALLPRPKRLPYIRRLISAPFRQPVPEQVDGFRFEEGQLIAATSRVFKDQPRRLMRAFLHAQQRGLKLHPDLAQLMRRELALIDRSFLKDEHVRETFLQILSQRGSVSRILRAMHEVGFLGKYLPEFGKLTCLVQHEFYHQYAADEHTLMCIDQLDRVWGAPEPPLDKYADVFQNLERPFILYLALLLHDAGKADDTGKHAEIGGRLALNVARRLNLDGATTHSLRLLIEHHLSMAQVSQRRDLEDAGVIRSFATQVQNVENLKMLTLLTFADSRATSDKLWNEFKDSLLWQLHLKALQVLQGGTEFVRAEERQRQLLKDEVAREAPKNISAEEIDAHFEALPGRYFDIHQAREIMVDLTQAHRFMHHQIAEEEKALEPIVYWHNEPDRGYTVVKICTWDRAGLFSKIAGSFAAAGINILSAQVFSRDDGIVLDTFFATDARSGKLVNREEREQFEAILSQTLVGEKVDFPAIMAKGRRPKSLFQSLEGERLPTKINFDNETSDFYTIVEIETEDRLGLLYTVSHIFAELGLNIELAKISTEKGAAIDAFYVTEAGKKILDAARQRFIATHLRQALLQLV